MMTQLITIGRITAPQGIRGEVRVVPLTDFPERFRHLTSVYISCPDGKEPWRAEVSQVRYHKQFVLLKFKGIEDRNAAEKLRNCRLQVEPSEVVPLPPGRYYHFQIIGLKVKTLAGEDLGEVKEILTPGGNDVYVVQDEAGHEVLIPAVKQVVREIDLDRRVMWVKLFEGLR